MESLNGLYPRIGLNMTDEEVGELWKEWFAGAYRPMEEFGRGDVVCNLIVKIIKERAELICWEGRNFDNGKREACADFGIPYDDFKVMVSVV
jgi:hypothetical protein